MAESRVNFFKKWSPPMAYILGYIIADGCLVSTRNGTSHILNITSKDYNHLQKIKKLFYSHCTISQKKNSSGGFGYQIQIRNKIITADLLKLGIRPRKTYNLRYRNVPSEFFPHFARGFFDGDGTVYIYRVNGTPQIKAGFVSASEKFLSKFSNVLSDTIKIRRKKFIRRLTKGASELIRIILITILTIAKSWIIFSMVASRLSF